VETQALTILAPVAIPAVICPLADAVADAMRSLHLAAATAGLPDVHLTTRYKALGSEPAEFQFVLYAKRSGMEWHQAPVEGKGATLAEAEQQFYTELRDYEQAAYEADPTRKGEQVCDMFKELGAYDYAA
jgi:hypothetical protein